MRNCVSVRLCWEKNNSWTWQLKTNYLPTILWVSNLGWTHLGSSTDLAWGHSWDCMQINCHPKWPGWSQIAWLPCLGSRWAVGWVTWFSSRWPLHQLVQAIHMMASGLREEERERSGVCIEDRKREKDGERREVARLFWVLGQNWCNITSAKSFWSKQIKSLAQIQGLGKQTIPRGETTNDLWHFFSLSQMTLDSK